MCDALLEVVERPEELNEHALERGLGRFMARHMAAGSTPSLRMFTDLFRLVGDQGLTIPAEVAAVFRALATLEGSLDRLAAGFDLVGETRSFAQDQLAEQLHPAALQRSATDELASLLPLLRRLPRHVDRIAGALDQGRLGIKVRLFADREETHLVTGLLHQALLTILAATSGIMAVLMLGLHGGARLTPSVSLFQFLGYCLLVIAAILALRVLAAVFWRSRE